MIEKLLYAKAQFVHRLSLVQKILLLQLKLSVTLGFLKKITEAKFKLVHKSFKIDNVAGAV